MDQNLASQKGTVMQLIESPAVNLGALGTRVFRKIEHCVIVLRDSIFLIALMLQIVL